MLANYNSQSKNAPKRRSNPPVRVIIHAFSSLLPIHQINAMLSARVLRHFGMQQQFAPSFVPWNRRNKVCSSGTRQMPMRFRLFLSRRVITKHQWDFIFFSVLIHVHVCVFHPLSPSSHVSQPLIYGRPQNIWFYPTKMPSLYQAEFKNKGSVWSVWSVWWVNGQEKTWLTTLTNARNDPVLS